MFYVTWNTFWLPPLTTTLREPLAITQFIPEPSSTLGLKRLKSLTLKNTKSMNTYFQTRSTFEHLNSVNSFCTRDDNILSLGLCTSRFSLYSIWQNVLLLRKKWKLYYTKSKNIYWLYPGPMVVFKFVLFI